MSFTEKCSFFAAAVVMSIAVKAASAADTCHGGGIRRVVGIELLD